MFNIFDEITEEQLLDFIDNKRDEICVTQQDFDYVMQILDEHGIKTYQFLDADEVIIQRINDEENLLNKKERLIMKVTAKRTGTKVTTGKVRLSYAHLFEPHAMNDGQEPKYSVSVIIPKSDKETLKAIKEATDAAKELGKDKWKGKIPANLKTPLRDGDTEREDEAYAGCYFLNANSKNKPGIVDVNVQPILDATEVYSGCYARLTLNFYPYSASGNNGIACGLGNVQKLEDGEPLGGFSRAEDDFDAISEAEDDFLG